MATHGRVGREFAAGCESHSNARALPVRLDTCFVEILTFNKIRPCLQPIRDILAVCC